MWPLSLGINVTPIFVIVVLDIYCVNGNNCLGNNLHKVDN